MYAGETNLAIDDFSRLWRGVGLGAALISDMMAGLRRQSRDPAVLSGLDGMFETMVSDYTVILQPE